MSGETSKKVTSADVDCFLCKGKTPILKEKVNLEIGAFIDRSLGVDLSGVHNTERATSIRSCPGVFKDKFIFRTVLARILNIF